MSRFEPLVCGNPSICPYIFINKCQSSTPLFGEILAEIISILGRVSIWNVSKTDERGEGGTPNW